MNTHSSLVPFRQVVAVSVVVTLIVAVRLLQCAMQTGNYEGMWFSLAHTIVVALGVIVACRP